MILGGAASRDSKRKFHLQYWKLLYSGTVHNHYMWVRRCRSSCGTDRRIRCRLRQQWPHDGSRIGIAVRLPGTVSVLREARDSLLFFNILAPCLRDMTAAALAMRAEGGARRAHRDTGPHRGGQHMVAVHSY